MLKQMMENRKREQTERRTSDRVIKITPPQGAYGNESLEIEPDGTKVIIRKFDMPLPCRNVQSSRRASSLFTPKDRWKYQHIVPDGKFVTKLMHVFPNTMDSSCGAKVDSSSISNSQVLLLKQCHNETARELSQNKGYIVVKPNEQKSNALVPGSKTANTEKITVNNLPENVIPNSLKIVDSKIVNGRKVVYLKAFKGVGKEGNFVSSGGLETLSMQANVAADSIPVLAVTKPSESIELNKIDPILGKTASVIRSSSTSLPLTIKKDDHTNPNTAVSSGAISLSNLKYYTRTTPAVSILSQNNNGLKITDIPITGSLNIVSPSKSNLTKISNNGREITVQLRDGPSKLHGTILNCDNSSQNVQASERSKSGISNDVLLLGKHIINIDEKINKDNCLKLVPADSTTPFISTGIKVPDISSENNLSSSEVVGMDYEKSETSMEGMTGIGKINSNTNCVKPVLTVNCNQASNSDNIVIVNQIQNSLPDYTGALISKQVSKYGDIMRRRKIALEYQREVHKSKELPRTEKIVELPARNVRLADVATQTTLFCMLEPGRIVEMLVNDDSCGETLFEPTKSTNICPGTIDRSRVHVLGTSRFHSNSRILTEIMDAPCSKRMRLDLGNSTSNTTAEINIAKENSMQTISMDATDFQQSQFQNLEKEDFLQLNNMKASTKSSKDNENDVRNINELVPSACMQSTTNSNANINEINEMNCQFDKKIKKRLYQDFRESLIPDTEGNLPIHNAVMDRKVNLVRRQCLILTAQKHEVDVKNSMQETPLHLAVLCNDLQIVNLLLKYSAKPNIPDGEGNTALHMAIKWVKESNILEALLKCVEDNSPVLNEPNDEGYSLLHLCALHNKEYEALLLMKKNADINIRDRKSGRTPLFHAVESGSTEMSHLLVNSGASTTIANFSGQTPLNASELTFVLDKLNENTTVSKEVVAPCSCRSEMIIGDHETFVCKDTDIQGNTNIEDLCSTDIDVCEVTDLPVDLLACALEQGCQDR